MIRSRCLDFSKKRKNRAERESRSIDWSEGRVEFRDISIWALPLYTRTCYTNEIRVCRMATFSGECRAGVISGTGHLRVNNNSAHAYCTRAYLAAFEQLRYEMDVLEMLRVLQTWTERLWFRLETMRVNFLKIDAIGRHRWQLISRSCGNVLRAYVEYEEYSPRCLACFDFFLKQTSRWQRLGGESPLKWDV